MFCYQSDNDKGSAAEDEDEDELTVDDPLEPVVSAFFLDIY